MTENQLDGLIKKSIDMHFHIGPDILPRKYTVEKLIKEEEGKISGIALKAHSFPTISYIQEAEENLKTKLKLVGSITLNYFMGGFNPSAVYASSVLSKKHPLVVWFPTIHAENHLKKNYSKYEIPPEWVRDKSFKPRLKTELRAIKVIDWNNRLFEKCERVLRMIAKMNCILATGHLSWQEAKILSLAALDMGIKVIVTHPMQKDIAMPLRMQKKLAGAGAYIEYCYIMYLDRDKKSDYPPEVIASNIKEIGVDQCIMTSDSGQTKNPSPSSSLKAFVRLLEPHGLEQADFKRMLVENPRKLLK